MKYFKIGNKFIGEKRPVFIIAEAGINYNGSFKIAERLVEEAARVGVDAVKFQIVIPQESYATKTAAYKIYKKAMLDFEAWKALKKKAESRGLIFFATPGGIRSLKILKMLRVAAIKISSGNMNNIPLLDEVGRLKLPVILSTGMSDITEVRRSVQRLRNKGTNKIAIMHCTSLYPARPEELNLNAIVTLKKSFDFPIGYSDHTCDDTPIISAVALGAKLIEKHFTLSKDIRCPDRAISYDPQQMKEVVRKIRMVEKSLGDFVKRPTEREKAQRDILRRALVADDFIVKGTVITKDMIGIKRTKTKPGLDTNYYYKVMGKRAKRDIQKDESITLNMIDNRFH